MSRFTVTFCLAALAAWIMTETILTQELQIHVAMGTNRAFLEIAASVKPGPDSSNDLMHEIIRALDRTVQTIPNPQR